MSLIYPNKFVVGCKWVVKSRLTQTEPSIYTYMCVCLYVYYVSIYSCTYMHIYIHTYTQIHTRTYIHVGVCVCMYTCILRMYVHVRMIFSTPSRNASYFCRESQRSPPSPMISTNDERKLPMPMITSSTMPAW